MSTANCNNVMTVGNFFSIINILTEKMKNTSKNEIIQLTFNTFALNERIFFSVQKWKYNQPALQRSQEQQ